VATVRVVAYDQNNSMVNSCPVRIGTPCQTTAPSDCSDPSQCPLQPEEIILPGGTLYHDLNADNPAYWHAANNWSNWNSTNNNFYDVWWYASHVVFNNDGIMRLLLDAAPPPANPTPVIYSSGEYRTNATYGYGTYEVCMKAAKGPGLMTSFFTYTGPPDTPQHHEIDVEFRGQNTWEMWTNFFYDNTDHAQAIQLGFDAAEDFHRYKFVWTQNDIKWYVDGVEKHPEYSTNYPGWPTLPGKIMVNLWGGNSISDNWLGDFCAAQIPVTADYDWIRW
jgi:beta-glucanase (GH16 family)